MQTQRLLYLRWPHLYLLLLGLLHLVFTLDYKLCV